MWQFPKQTHDQSTEYDIRAVPIRTRLIPTVLADSCAEQVTRLHGKRILCVKSLYIAVHDSAGMLVELKGGGGGGC